DGGGGAGAPAGVVIDPEAAMMLARALKDLASAKKADADLILKLKAELAKEMAAKLDEEAKTNRGLDAPTVARLKAGFLGIKG
ncbi:MAG TPA: DUF3486 family protein, partial [Azospirillaceae bacterium]|nr:DUF3486 family protein [Azospirillaceae bacterium]